MVSYHGLFVYLLDRFHIEEAAKVEPKPGIDPTPRHVVSVVKKMKSDGARVVLYAAHHPERTARQVAEQGGGVAVKLAHMPDALSGTSSYFDAVELNISRLVEALRETESR